MPEIPGETTLAFMKRGVRHFVPANLPASEALMASVLLAAGTFAAQAQYGGMTPRSVAISAFVAVTALPAVFGAAGLVRRVSDGDSGSGEDGPSPGP